MSKKLKINDRVVVQFLGAKYESQVIAIRPDSHYDLRKTDGTIIPNCAWQKDAHKKAPWWIVARIDGGVDWIEYVFHCDFENAKSSRCIQSLKERLSLGYRGFKIQNIRLLEANYNANSYQDFAKKRDLIVQRAMINKA